jgi:2'-5' RNA ligase
VRLFAAIDLDEIARLEIERLQRRIRKALAERPVNMVDPAQMHVTLVFLGEIAEAVAPPILEALSADIKAPPFDIEFEGLGVFPPRRAPRTLWLGVKKGAGAIADVQHEVGSRVVAAGVVLERRPFHPHVTLLRWRESRSADRERALAADPRGAIARTLVDRVTLYQSRLTQAGPVYTALTRANLT